MDQRKDDVVRHAPCVPMSLAIQAITAISQVMQNVSEDQDRQPAAARKIRADHTLKFIMEISDNMGENLLLSFKVFVFVGEECLSVFSYFLATTFLL